MSLLERRDIRQAWRDSLAIKRRILELDIEIVDLMAKRDELLHAILLDESADRRMARHGVKLLDEQLGSLMDEIERLRESEIPVREIAEEYGVCASHIIYLCRPRY